MKRKWILAAALVTAVLGVAAFAQADDSAPFTRPGFGRWAQGTDRQQGAPGAGFMGGGRGMMGGRGATGGPGMMRGGGMMGGRGGMFAQGAPGGTVCNGQSYDPAAISANLEKAIALHQAYIADMEAQLKGADEKTAVWINERLAFQRLMLGYQQGKLALAGQLTLPWPEGAIALANYDLDYFSKVDSADSWVRSWVERRLSQVKQRLEYLQSQGAAKN